MEIGSELIPVLPQGTGDAGRSADSAWGRRGACSNSHIRTPLADAHTNTDGFHGGRL